MPADMVLDSNGNCVPRNGSIAIVIQPIHDPSIANNPNYAQTFKLWIRNETGGKDNVIIAAKLRSKPSFPGIAMSQDIINLFGLWDEVDGSGTDSVLYQSFPQAEAATALDAMYGKTLEAMGPGVISPFNTVGFGPMSVSSATFELSSYQKPHPNRHMFFVEPSSTDFSEQPESGEVVTLRDRQGRAARFVYLSMVNAPR